MKKFVRTGVCALVMSTGVLAAGPIDAGQQTTPDNTKANKDAMKSSAQTADKAMTSASDRDLMKQIRQAVVKDKSLSTYARNVKIIADHGKVTLKGPVNSEDEKKAIGEHARKIAGEANVVDELTVKGDQK